MANKFDPDYLVASGQVHKDWLPALEKCRKELSELELFLDSEIAQGKQILPETQNIFRALQLSPHDVRVVIVGQDPYPTPGYAVGLAFSVSAGTQPIPKSLNNIFTELHADVGCKKPATGDLSLWAHQGVLLLNRVLTVEAGNAGSHRSRGWEKITEVVLRLLSDIQDDQLVAILWGNDAQTAKGFLGTANITESAHPSPLAARRGFSGSKPFSSANSYLEKIGIEPIQWCLNSQSTLF